MRKQLVSGKKLLLFVDTGDNCRCPLAIGYLTKLLKQKNIEYVELKHMGVMTPNDLLPTPEVVQLLKEEGVDIRYHRSRPLNPDLIRQADLVIGFTAIHVQTCLRRVPECKDKTFLLKDYVGLAHTGDQIHDPMGSTMEIFKKYFSEIRQSLHRLVEMEFITDPPEPKEVVILPTIIKPRLAEEDDLPAGYYDQQEMEQKAAKAAKARNRTKAEKAAYEAKVAEEMAEKDSPKSAKADKKPAPKKADAPANAAKSDPEDKAKKAAKADKSAKVAKKAEAKPVKKTAVKADKPAKVKADKPVKVAKKAAPKDKVAAKAKAKPAAKPDKAAAKKK